MKIHGFSATVINQLIDNFLELLRQPNQSGKLTEDREQGEFFLGNLPKDLSKDDIHKLLRKTTSQKEHKDRLYIKRPNTGDQDWVVLEYGLCKIHRFHMATSKRNGSCFVTTGKEYKELLIQLSRHIYYEAKHPSTGRFEKTPFDFKEIDQKKRQKAYDDHKAKLPSNVHCGFICERSLSDCEEHKTKKKLCTLGILDIVVRRERRSPLQSSNSSKNSDEENQSKSRSKSDKN